MANQLGRRNLTDEMRIEVALLKADMLRKKAQKNQKEAGGDKISAKNEGTLLSKTSKPENEKVHVQIMLTGLLHREENAFTENFTKYIVKHCRNQKHMIIYRHERPAAKPSCRKSKLKVNKITTEPSKCLAASTRR